MKKKSVGVGLMGLGVVGGQVARVLIDRGEVLAEHVGCPLALQRVKVLPSDLTRPQAKEMEPRLFTTDADAFYADQEIDIVVEVIGGESPALEYIRRALSTGKHVVTANKEVIAKHGAELFALAQKHQVGLHFEASAGGGIPLISPFQHDLVANRIEGIYAIINGTTNYILTIMARGGMDFSLALKSAQESGFAEANPENDINGIDAAYKLAAKELGFTIKLLAIAKRSDDSIEARVHPVFIPEDSLLAKVDGVNNAILVEGDLVGKVLFYGQGAGGLPTSSAIIADVVSAAQDIVTGVGNRIRWKLQTGRPIKPMAEIETQYYLRLNVADRPGVLAQISKILGDHLISISSVIQKLTDKAAQSAELVVMTHPAQEKAMKQALEEVAHLEVVKEISNFIRVEE